MNSEVVYLGSDNVIVRHFTFAKGVNGFKVGDPLPFVSGKATKMELYINGQTVTSESGALTFEDGKVTIDLSGVKGLKAKRSYKISMRVWDERNKVNGQLFCHPEMRQSNFNVEAVKSEM
jgi:hypothetical protein